MVYIFDLFYNLIVERDHVSKLFFKNSAFEIFDVFHFRCFPFHRFSYYDVGLVNLSVESFILWSKGKKHQIKWWSKSWNMRCWMQYTREDFCELIMYCELDQYFLSKILVHKKIHSWPKKWNSYFLWRSILLTRGLKCTYTYNLQNTLQLNIFPWNLQDENDSKPHFKKYDWSADTLTFKQINQQTN